MFGVGERWNLWRRNCVWNLTNISSNDAIFFQKLFETLFDFWIYLINFWKKKTLFLKKNGKIIKRNIISELFLFLEHNLALIKIYDKNRKFIMLYNFFSIKNGKLVKMILYFLKMLKIRSPLSEIYNFIEEWSFVQKFTFKKENGSKFRYGKLQCKQ